MQLSSVKDSVGKQKNTFIDFKQNPQNKNCANYQIVWLFPKKTRKKHIT